MLISILAAARGPAEGATWPADAAAGRRPSAAMNGAAGLGRPAPVRAPAFN
jgi:hypothetical protein